MRIITALLLFLALAACAAAPGRVLLFDETEQVGRAVIEAAAAPLVARGAVVAVFVVAQGDAAGADFQGRLAEADLLKDEERAPEAIALYVSFAPRYSELRAGTRWSGDLPDAALREVREGALNPALREGRVAAGVADTLLALEGRLANPPLLERVIWWFLYVGSWPGSSWRCSPSRLSASGSAAGGAAHPRAAWFNALPTGRPHAADGASGSSILRAPVSRAARSTPARGAGPSPWTSRASRPPR